jgi:hypothetical protein
MASTLMNPTRGRWRLGKIVPAAVGIAMCTLLVAGMAYGVRQTRNAAHSAATT